MQHNSADESGQTEPLAALVAVIVVCLAFSAYTGVLASVFSTLGTDRDVTDGTTERIWEQLSEDGIFDTQGADIEESVDSATLPRGRYVHISVTSVGDDGHLMVDDAAGFNPQGEPATVDPPESADEFDRSIPIRHRRGDIRPGTLEVVVWE